jgi:hypothetical protein
VILLSFGETVNTNGPDKMGGASAGWRWVLEVERWSVFLHQQALPRPVTDESRWSYLTSGYFGVSVSEHWMWGSDHGYYDGPHCSFSVGPVHFLWSYWRCERCEKGE